MGKKNGYFQLAEDEKGTCLKVFPPEDGGSRVVVEDVMKYCKAIKLADYNLGGLEAYLQGWDTLAEPFHLTSFRVPTQDEVVLVEADSRGEEAYGRFYPPTEGGALLDKDEIVQALVAGKVVFGLQEDLLEEFLYNREYCKDILLAKAMPPEDGKDAEVTYHFNTSQVSKPKLGEDGSVDFHSLDNIQGVKKGDLLVTLTPADPGKPGMTVFGKVVKPKNVTRKVLKQGNNYTVSEDGLTIHSDVSGHVALVNGDIVVSDIYTVPEDVGFSTGDIAYDGNVEVRGNVLSGFVVKASGSIIVDGVVEGATLRAGAEIILKRGIQGMSKGILEADGNIITKFIENSEVVSGGDIITDAIMHSQVTARGRVTVVGKRGMISGGRVMAGSVISAKKAGSNMGTVTILEIGADPEVMVRYKELEQSIEEHKRNEEKVNNRLAMFNDKMLRGVKLSAEEMQYFRKLNKSLMLLNKQHYKEKDEFDVLSSQLGSYKSGSVRIEGPIFPGVKIVISGSVYQVNDEMYKNYFVRDAGDVYVRNI